MYLTLSKLTEISCISFTGTLGSSEHDTPGDLNITFPAIETTGNISVSPGSYPPSV
jgi:hypothetical protein